ncbi:MAG: CRISPR-associated helicase/endonuclease Cas3, partial [Proteobacteria bacterium]|nr:CRISPR-associated helicase/endonuclease Cas3 [Pseudomonadota bacterium]
MLLAAKKNKLEKVAIPYSDCLAKTYKNDQGVFPGRSVFNHCQIVGYVARAILSRIPLWLRSSLFPEGSELVAASHDVGKVSPTFQEKIYRAIDNYFPNSKEELVGINPEHEIGWGGHGGVSQLTAQMLQVGQYIPEILGQHHGYSPTLKLKGCESWDHPFGGHAWHNEREKLINQLKKELNCDWPAVTSEAQMLVLSGLTTVADWIGSNSFFENPNDPWQDRVHNALDSAGFKLPIFTPGLSFTEIFGFQPHNLQIQFFENVIEPGVYLLEAPMGLGKTEAALYAAYLTMVSGKATGLYFALPTRLTSDKIYDRVQTFLTKILQTDHSAKLIHSSAWLRNLDQNLGEDGQPSGSWFEPAKKSILWPFAVGTVDQALMAVINVKHGFVRAFGLAGKVVILDEVHSYDMYTGTLLDQLI